MNRNHTLTDGPLLPAIFHLALPAVLSFLLQGTYNFVDTYFVGYLGAESLAGISTGSFILWMLFGLASLISIGVAAKVSRRMGEQNRQEANCAAARGIWYTLGTSICLAVPFYFLLPTLFDFMQTSPQVTAEGKAYIVPLVIGLPIIFLNFVIVGIFNASGDTRTPFLLMLLTLSVNALLDPLFIFGLGPFPAFGIAGAAWATVISRIVFTFLALRKLHRPDCPIHLQILDKLGITWAEYFEVVRIGLPKALTGVLFSGIYMALTRVTAEFGTPNIAALRIGHIFEGLSFFTAAGFSIAASTLVGQNLGAQKPQRAMRAAWTVGGIVFAYATLVGLLFRLFADHLAGVFSTDESVILAGASYLMILAWSQPFMGIEIVMEGGFSGAGNTLPPMIIQVPLTLLRYPVAVALAFSTTLGVEGVWWAISGSSLFKGILMTFWFSRGRWRHTKV